MQIDKNGVIRWGQDNETQCIILPDAQYSRQPLDFLVDRLTYATTWGIASNPVLTGGVRVKGTVLYGQGDGVAFYLLYRGEKNATDALRAIEQQGELLPTALCAAFLVAERGLRNRLDENQISAAVIYACAGLTNIPTKTGRQLSAREVESAASSLFALNISAATGLSALSFARVMLEVGKLLWRKPKNSLIEDYILLSRERPGTVDGITALGLSGLLVNYATIEILMAERFEISLEGVKLSIAPETAGRAYIQIRDMLRNGISRDTLRLLIPDGTLAVGDLMLEHDVPAIASGMAAAFLREAHEKAVYVPSGAFQMDWPHEIEFPAPIETMYIHAFPDHLWVRLDIENGAPVIFRWNATGDVSTLLIPKTTLPLISLVLAGLWRDLRVAGDLALPADGDNESARPSRSAARRASINRTRSLPGKRRLNIPRRKWAAESEREAIRKQAHGVRGHLRQLPETWRRSEDAADAAEQFGMVLPDGYTFVKPHVRGLDDGELQPVKIQARGLATLLQIFGKE